MTLPDLAAVVRKSGLRVVELPGWRTRGRPASTGGFDPRGVLCHHTGGAPDSREYAEWMATEGRSDLPAPLCHLALSREGIVYVCAAGRANHAGESGGSGPIPAGDGNALLVGIEAMNTGSEGWGHPGQDAAGNPVTQGEAYARLCAALCVGYDWPASHVRAHRETSTTGKWDPGLLDMDKHRAAVARIIRNGLEDDMAQYAEQLDTIERLTRETRKAIGSYRKVDAQRYRKQIREDRAAGRTAEQIVEAIDKLAAETESEDA